MAEGERPEALPRGALWLRMLALGAVGAVAGLGQAPVSLPWATLAALGLAVSILLRAQTPGRAAALGWATGTGYFAATLFWIVEPFFVDAARHGWMAPFALAGMAGGLALFWAAAWGAAAWLAPRGGLWRGLAWAVALAVAEAARTYVMTGFPWALVGHVWAGWAPMQLGALAGPIGLTLLTALLPGVVVPLMSRPWRVAAALVPFAGVYLLGAWLGAQPLPERVEPPVLRLVQPNAPQHLKWNPDWAPVFFARQLDMTASPPGEPGAPTLVIWPETAVPYLLNSAAPALERVAVAAEGVPVILGIQRVEGVRAYNSMVRIGPGGVVEDVYDKHHLVPFGEYMPLPGLMRMLGLRAFTAQEGYGYSPGPGAALMELGGGLGAALPLICYEAIFPQDLRAAPGRADWILQITNDAWFGTLSGPYQHLAQARLRAVEQGLPFVRVANTGVSAVIDARGRVLAFLPLGQAGHLDAALPAALPPTVYARTGDLPVFLLLAGALAGLLVRRPGGLGRKSD